MDFTIKIRPQFGLATMKMLVDQLAARARVDSAASMDQLVRSAFALRHAAHLQRCFGPWLRTLAEKERAAVEALLRELVIESVEEGDGRIDGHGGYRGEIQYELVGSARTVGLRHFYGYNNIEQLITSSVTFDDRGSDPTMKKASKKAAKKLESERLAFESPTDLAPAAELLFAWLGAEDALSRGTRLRFLLRLLFPWGRYLHGYDGATPEFYEDADRLFALSRARRASELRAREDDGEIIPFFIG
jgi:hypothetical protein